MCAQHLLFKNKVSHALKHRMIGSLDKGNAKCSQLVVSGHTVNMWVELQQCMMESSQPYNVNQEHQSIQTSWKNNGN